MYCTLGNTGFQWAETEKLVGDGGCFGDRGLGAMKRMRKLEVGEGFRISGTVETEGAARKRKCLWLWCIILEAARGVGIIHRSTLPCGGDIGGDCEILNIGP